MYNYYVRNFEGHFGKTAAEFKLIKKNVRNLYIIVGIFFIVFFIQADLNLVKYY